MLEYNKLSMSSLLENLAASSGSPCLVNFFAALNGTVLARALAISAVQSL